MVKRGTPSKGGEEGEERQRGCPVPSSPGFQALRAVFGLAPETRPGTPTASVCLSGRAEQAQRWKLDDVGLWYSVFSSGLKRVAGERLEMVSDDRKSCYKQSRV